MNVKKYFFLFFTLIAFAFNTQQTNNIAIYGSNSCDHCINLKKALDSARIEYKFYDIDVNKVKEDEMVSLLNKYRRGGNVIFPVAEVNGNQLIIGADYGKITEALKKE